MKKTTLLLLPVPALLAILALSACGKDDGVSGNAASAGAGAAGGLSGSDAREEVPASAARGLPRPDMKKSLDDYPELQSGQQIMFLYTAASRLPPDFAKLAEHYSRDYRDTSDSFRKNDLLQAIKPQLEQQIAAAAASPYAWMPVDNAQLGAYDFERKGFPVNEFDNEGQRYFRDNHGYKLSWANRDQVRFAGVADEAQARELESMRTRHRLGLKVYFFAQGANLNSQTIDAHVTRVQVVDRDGRVLADYGPNSG